mmetsp:Transcript_97810/g.273828  ORF Transcript_97810/g.273828 Transcript_97810/m.273828 type:complete len:117 (+) Transcript_97810:94-444(+)|eukprot:CAMPEP_0176217274 /NCGR_PEP_ID=MMETSP0121_2-20121125/17612_1 /TAXON_ID=160619 /ORGANISM="Kryptoperidinium foliaceum, Strain CCMP 1326" /LENGTH=116 /DNA_ID=CAMNT_0017556407 /DNA_START=17 /DNA_END=367 /DNA_ORIENTATION=-
MFSAFVMIAAIGASLSAAAGEASAELAGASCGLEEQDDLGLLQVKEPHDAETVAEKIHAHSDTACNTYMGPCVYQCPHPPHDCFIACPPELGPYVACFGNKQCHCQGCNVNGACVL